MYMKEDVLEEILFSHPEEFFPQLQLLRYARQLALGARSGGSRIDVAFQDASDKGIWLFEIKAANKVTLDVVGQVTRYLADVERLSFAKCECPFPTPPRAGVIAPIIPRAIKAALAAGGIPWHEFPESKFIGVARTYGIPLTMTIPTGLRLTYWASLDQHLRQASGSVPGIRPAESNYMNVTSTNGLQLTLRCSAEHNCLDVDLTFTARGAPLFPSFCHCRNDIDRDLGQTVLWFKQGTERHIRVQHWADVRNEAAWPQFHEWMRTQGEVLTRWARRISRGY